MSETLFIITGATTINTLKAVAAASVLYVYSAILRDNSQNECRFIASLNNPHGPFIKFVNTITWLPAMEISGQ